MVEFLLWAWAMVGHFALWCAIYNQLHATAWPRFTRKLLEKLIYLAIVLIAVAITAFGLRHGIARWEPYSDLWQWAPRAYLWICWIAAIAFAIRWTWRRLRHEAPPGAQRRLLKYISLNRSTGETLLHGWQARLLNLIPGNQILDLAVEQLVVRVDSAPRRESRADSATANPPSLSIVHLSDLHFTGKVDRRYFQRVIEECNALRPDLVALTGDIVDCASCLDWIQPVLGEVQAPLGKYFVLGNHDLRIRPADRLRAAMETAGWIDASRRWQVVGDRQLAVVIAGNESPWFTSPAVEQPPPPVESQRQMRLLLAHTPDLFSWSCRRKFDIVLCGHTHGGQVRLPIVGPVIAPSRFGVKYAGGVFRRDGTWMIVSRGISADDPIRWNCAPELTLVQVQWRAAAEPRR